MDLAMDMGDERVAQILSKGYKHFFNFSHRFSLTAGGVGTAFQPPTGFDYQIGQESWWVWTKISVWCSPAAPVGTGNALESVQIAFRTTSSGRDHQSEEYLPIQLLGTIGYPYPISTRQFFNRSTTLRLFIRNLSAGLNTADVMVHGFRFYPDPQTEEIMSRAFARLVSQGLQ
jgi:hypothetical protein